MTGLVPVIHVAPASQRLSGQLSLNAKGGKKRALPCVDGRDKPGHDSVKPLVSLIGCNVISVRYASDKERAAYDNL